MVTKVQITRGIKERKLAEAIARDPMTVAKLLISMQSDISSMLTTKTLDDEHLFGGFSTSYEDVNEGTFVSWPNLEILHGKLTKLLEKQGFPVT